MTEQTKLIEILDPQAGKVRETVLTGEAPVNEQSALMKNGERMSLKEAATTYSSTFPQLLQADLQTRFFNTYRGIPMTHQLWVDNMRSNRPTEQYLKDSPLGTAPKVLEGHPYPRVELDLDEVVNIANAKYGFIIPVTKEAIKFDQYNVLMQRTADRARSMAYTKEIAAYQVISTSGNFTRTTAAGDNDIGNNTAATQFSATGLSTAFKTLQTMKDSKSGVYLNVMPNTLIAGVGLTWAINQLIMSPTLSGQGETDAIILHGQGASNPFRGVVNRIVITPFLAQYNWVLMEARRAVMFQQVWDLEMTQTGPTNYNYFQSDELEFKVSEFWGVGMLDDRFAYYSSDSTGPTVT